MAAIILTTTLAGLFFWLLGRFRLGGLVRFLPYPVVGGFLAGTGWLFVTGALDMMLDLPSGVAPQHSLAAAHALALAAGRAAGPGHAAACCAAPSHFLVLPGFLIGALLLFFAAAALSDTTLAELSAGGWLLGPFEETGELAVPGAPGPAPGELERHLVRRPPT